MIDPVNQRVTLVWKYISGKQVEIENVPKEGWYAIHIHISLAQNLQGKKWNYTHISETLLTQFAEKQQGKKELFRDTKGCLHSVIKSQIIRFQRKDGLVHIYCNNGTTFSFRKNLTQLEEQMGKQFARANQSCLVNVDYIVKISNYKMYLKDDTVISVPSENYRKRKESIMKKMLARSAE